MSQPHSHKRQAGFFIPLASITNATSTPSQMAGMPELSGQPVDVDRLFVMTGKTLGGVFAVEGGRVTADMIGSYLIIDDNHVDGVAVFTDANGTEQVFELGQYESRDAFFDGLIEWHLSRNRALKPAAQQSVLPC